MSAERRASISRRVIDIANQFYSEQAEEKTLQLENEAFIHAEALGLDDNFTVHVERGLLTSLVESYIYDIIRFKEYHFNCSDEDPNNEASKNDWREFAKYKNINPESNEWIVLKEKLLEDRFCSEWLDFIHIKSVNNAKKAAFTAKWILQSKPITILRENKIPDGNEWRKMFAVNATFAFRMAMLHLDIKENSVPIPIVQEVLYSFLFRRFDESWAMTMFEHMRMAYGTK